MNASVRIALRPVGRALPRTQTRSKGYYLTREEVAQRNTRRRATAKAAVVIAIGFPIGFSIPYYVRKYILDLREEEREKVLVLGSGWGSLSFSSSVDTNKYDVKVISPRNYFLFSPLLSHVAVGKLHDFSIKETFRHALARADRADIQFAEAECTKIDPNAKTITCRRSDGSVFEESYDKLVIAVGAAQNTFGVNGVHQHCNFFKNIEDAKKIHHKIISNIELASAPGLSSEERARLMHIVIVGGSPVSVQLASELKKYLDDILKKRPDLRDIAKISFIEQGDHIKNVYDRRISETMWESYGLEKSEMVLVRKDAVVQSVDRSELTIEQQGAFLEVPYGICIWSTGVTPLPLIEDLKRDIPEQTSRWAITTDDFLTVKGLKDVYAIGDCATVGQRRLLELLGEIIEELDKDKNGVIEFAEFEELLSNEEYGKKFPQLGEFVDAKELFDAADKNADGVLDEDEMRAIFKKVDKNLTRLPGTAQTAQQQGRFLAKFLNNYEEEPEQQEGAAAEGGEEEDPNDDDDEDEELLFGFRYKHLGGFEYVGFSKPITERGSSGTAILNGLGAWWLWRSIYVSRFVSLKNRVLIAFDLASTRLFGREEAVN